MAQMPPASTRGHCDGSVLSASLMSCCLPRLLSSWSRGNERRESHRSIADYFLIALPAASGSGKLRLGGRIATPDPPLGCPVSSLTLRSKTKLLTAAESFELIQLAAMALPSAEFISNLIRLHLTHCALANKCHIVARWQHFRPAPSALLRIKRLVWRMRCKDGPMLMRHGSGITAPFT